MLDEPTAALGVAQTAEVLNLIERLRETGLGVILISHNMADVQAVADRIVVLRLGRNAAEFRVEEATTAAAGRRHHRAPATTSSPPATARRAGCRREEGAPDELSAEDPDAERDGRRRSPPTSPTSG